MEIHTDIRPALTILSEEEEMFRDVVRAFAEDEVRPRVMEMEKACKIAPDLIPKYFDLGLMGIEVAEETVVEPELVVRESTGRRSA